MLCAIYAVRVEFMARHVPSQAGNVTHDLFITLFFCTAATYQNEISQ